MRMPTHLAIKHPSPYTRPDYYYRLFHEGRPAEAIEADENAKVQSYNARKDAENKAISDFIRSDDFEKDLDSFLGRAPAEAPKEKVDPLAGLW